MEFAQDAIKTGLKFCNKLYSKPAVSQNAIEKAENEMLKKYAEIEDKNKTTWIGNCIPKIKH